MSEPRRSTPPVSTMVGTVLGAYRITSELSSGGMGTVYRGEHELLGRPAAIKLLRSELTHNDELVQRFFNEAKAATAIRHPGIIEIYDFGYTDEGYAYLVMEFLEGSQLGSRIEDKQRFTEIEAAQIARGIASALKAAHAKGIIHRDLKPDNIFLVPDPDGPTGERVKVLDFGIAKLNDAFFGGGEDRARKTQTGALMGTPLYMAPEQARAAGTIDARADLYSLGCILYELLVGKPPFVAEGIGEIIAMQMFTEPVPPRELLAEITPDMERLVMKLLAKEPDDRYGSAADVITELTALGARLSGRLSAQQPSTRPSAKAELALRETALSGESTAQPKPASSESKASAEAKPSTESKPSASNPGKSPSLRHSLAEDAPVQLVPEKRPMLPLVAGAITLAIAVIGIAFIATRDNSPPAPPTAAQGSAASTTIAVDAAIAVEPPVVDAAVAIAPTITPPPTAPPSDAPTSKQPVDDDYDLPPRADQLKDPSKDSKDSTRSGPVTRPDLDPKAKVEPKVEPKTDPQTVAPAGSGSAAPKGPRTEKGSPIEVDLDDKPPPDGKQAP